ncbi:hypothetical protein H0H81_001982 [Sphagnurus paluster]|uniref:Transcription initiation factor TFIID subunit 8 n=1 Tax=Sphagnurus paluster TaxID=117069 RepID=A0A9P7GU14_9AGAR|nr:hypothetical protein H0H81_001982 [Sphagnurus paluster]
MYQPATTADGAYNPYAHYPSQYTPLPYFPPFPHLQPPPQPEPSPELPPPPPDLTSITPAVASLALRRLLSAQLRDAGFDAAQPAALARLEVDVVAFLQQLFLRAHEYANLANRAGPIATDLVLACDEFHIPPATLRAVTRKRPRKPTTATPTPHAPALLPPPSRSPSPDLLPSDDEGAPVSIPPTLRTLPAFFPALPPKHTYLRTPASPPKRAALPSLEKKLKTAGLVQESLRNLLLATEDGANQEDGELLGHIVNCESTVHPRKRWKVARKTQ